MKMSRHNGSTIGLVLAVGTFAGLAAFLAGQVYQNILPFVAWGGQSVPRASGIFLIGWFVDVAVLVYHFLGSVGMWALVSVLEVLWLLIALDTKAHRYAARAVRNEKANGFDDDRYSRRLLKIPYFFIEWSPVLALAALTFDLIVNYSYRPFLNLPRLIAGIAIARPMGIDWAALGAVAWQLVNIELILVALIVTGQWIYSHRNG